MHNATFVLPFKMHCHYFLRVNFRPFSFFMRAKINAAHQWQFLCVCLQCTVTWYIEMIFCCLLLL